MLDSLNVIGFSTFSGCSRVSIPMCQGCHGWWCKVRGLKVNKREAPLIEYYMHWCTELLFYLRQFIMYVGRHCNTLARHWLNQLAVQNWLFVVQGKENKGTDLVEIVCVCARAHAFGGWVGGWSICVTLLIIAFGWIYPVTPQQSIFDHPFSSVYTKPLG